MPKKDLTDEQVAEDIMLDDKDPMDAIRDIRREEGVSEEDLPISLASSEGLDSDPEEPKQTDEEIAALKPADEKTDAEKEAEEAAEKEAADALLSDDEKAAAAAAATADAAIEAADKAADKAAGKDPVDDGEEKDPEKPGDADNTKPGDEEDAAPASRTFKANNQEFTFTEAEILEQFETVFGQAMNYTQKMQKIAPYRKMISALEQEGVTHDSLNLALDALKGDKGAIKKLLEKANIDAYSLTSEDDEEAPYVPGNYGKNETQLEIEEITGRIQGDDEFKITTNVIDEQWDDKSRQAIADSPNIIIGLHNDIKSGLYDKVAPVAMKMKVLDGHSKSDIEYYMLAGEQLRLKVEADHKKKEGEKSVEDLNKGAQNADSEFDKASSEADRKRAASSTGKRADRKGVIDYLDDDDEAYDAWYKNLNASI